MENIESLKVKLSAIPFFSRAFHNKDKDKLIIWNDIDIPKLYFYDLGKNNYEVIDGQQRLWAIWEYVDNEYSYNKKYFINK